jgi:hypothetical protein
MGWATKKLETEKPDRLPNMAQDKFSRPDDVHVA